MRYIVCTTPHGTWFTHRSSYRTLAEASEEYRRKAGPQNATVSLVDADSLTVLKQFYY